MRRRLHEYFIHPLLFLRKTLTVAIGYCASAKHGLRQVEYCALFLSQNLRTLNILCSEYQVFLVHL